MKQHSPHNRNIEMQIRENKTLRVQTINTEVSKTFQEFKEQCDVNNILRIYKTTGELTHLNKKQMINLPGQVLDCTQYPDYQSSLQTVVDANNAFMALPSSLRKKFNNNPEELLTFLSDPQNKDEAIKLGLVNKPVDVPQSVPEQKNKIQNKKQNQDVSTTIDET